MGSATAREERAQRPPPEEEQRTTAPHVQRAARVSRPGDAFEREADAVAHHVVSGWTTARAAHGPAPRVLRAVPPSGAGAGGSPAALPPVVERALVRPSAGHPLPSRVRGAVEPQVGTDLGAARVHTGRDAQVASAALGARAFTSGPHIYLGRGESPTDLRLMAHEATHVAQQASLGTAAVHRLAIMRDVGDVLGSVGLDVEDLIPESWLESIRGTVRSIPGYTLLSQVVGEDLLTGNPVDASRQEIVSGLLSHGPFGGAVGPVLETLDALDEVFDAVRTTLATYRLTLARIQADIRAAWDRFELANGIEGNVAIVRGYLSALLADVRRFVTDMVDRVIAMVRDAAVEYVEPLLETDPVGPAWRLAKKVLHHDPLRGTRVEAPTVEILADFLHLLGQDDVLEQMRERGTLQETADWLDTQWATFESLGTRIAALFSDAWAAIQPANLANILDTLPALASRAFALFGEVTAFATTVITKVLELVKRSLLGMLTRHAYAIPGFRLLSVILGRNPFTGEAVERSAENLIGGFITLLPGGEATYQQLAESGVIAEAATRIEGALSRLGITWDLVTQTFSGIWDSLSLEDLLRPVEAFARVVAQFGEPLSRILEFVTEVVQVVIELILRLMNFPSDLLASIISQVQAAIGDIQRDPVGFLVNMLEALKAGFQLFFDHILSHLLQGLAAWLFRGLGQLGITIPQELSLQSVLDLVLQVLGLSVDFLWTKLGEHIGEERVAAIRGALDTLSGAWDFIRDVQERGLAAVWEYVVDRLSGLWDSIIEMATQWITETVVNNVVTRLLSMLDPTGVMAVVNSVVAFFNAVQSAIEYIRDILEIVNMYVSTFAAVARGDIAPGAAMLEQGLAAAIPVAIGFLANQVGIGDIPDRIVAIIQRVRVMVEAAIDWLIQQALRLGAAALNALGLGEPSGDADGAGIDQQVTVGGTTHHLKDDGPGGVLALHSDTVLVNSIANPQLQALVARFNTATSRTARNEAAVAVGQWIAANMPVTGPGGSAPNIGRLERHGAQPVRLTTAGVPLWTLESEHVVPFMVVRHLWEAMGVEGVAPRSVLGSADRGLTTIMIYERAADAKTNAEGPRRDSAAEHLRTMTEQYAARPDADTPAADAVFRQQVMAFLRQQQVSFADFTSEKVSEEWSTQQGGTTHGQLRSEPAPVPATERIHAAAAREMDDAETILDEALGALVRAH